MPESIESVSRPFWSGTITFGLVSVPVNLHPANKSDRVSLRMVSPDGHPLSRRYFTTRDDKELKWEEIVRGYEIEKNRFVVVDDSELAQLAPDKTRDIDLSVFVKASNIDPMHFERAYYLTPAGTSTKAYRLLATAMEETDRIGIARFVMRAKEYLVAIIAENGILRAETLRFADEVRAPSDIGLPSVSDAPASQVKKMEKAMDAILEKEFDPDELVDPGAERVLKLVRKKKKAGDDVFEAPDEEAGDSGKIIDLVEMLQRSLQGKGEGEGEGGRPGTGTGAGTGTEELTDLTKAELYERAQEMEIPGRSEMTKSELISAIKKAG